MLFWSVAGLMTIAVAATLLRPLLVKTAHAEAEMPAPRAGSAADVALYKAQLDELARDQARGVLPDGEVESARTEIARRLLSAARQSPEKERGAGPRRVIAAGLALAFVAVAAITYNALGAPGYPDLPLADRLAAADSRRAERPSQAEAVAAAPAFPAVQIEGEYAETVAQLREIVPTRPDDLRGWELLAFHEAQLRNFAAAATAQERVVNLKAGDAGIDDYQRLLDLMVVAAGGFVSPEAERVAGALLDRDPRDPVGRYYLGALYNQTGRPDLAFRLWRPLVENGDIETFHVSAARDQIADAAYRAGVDYEVPALRGPTASDIEAASDLSAEDRVAMIEGMVAQLSERLATEGGPASDWARLIRAYGVLGETERASAIWTEAREVFAEVPEAVEMLRTAARAAGVAE